MRSWLYTPAVQLLGLLCSLLTLGQFTALACKRLSAILRADHEHRRVYSAAALGGLVALAVCAPLAWSADIRVEHQTGNPTLVSVIYPVLMTGIGALGCWMLHWNKRWPTEDRHIGPWYPGFFIFTGLVGVDALKFWPRPPAWEAYMLIGFPALVAAIYLLALAHEGVDKIVDQIRVDRADPVWREIRQLRRRARTSS